MLSKILNKVIEAKHELVDELEIVDWYLKIIYQHAIATEEEYINARMNSSWFKKVEMLKSSENEQLKWNFQT
jgi:hypothetical protein